MYARRRRGARLLHLGSEPTDGKVEAEYLHAGVVAVTTKADVARDRLPGALLAATVLVVQLVWGAALFYLGFHFL